MRRLTAGVAVAMALGGAESASAGVAESTSYCLRGTMADGSQTRAGSVAMNSLPLGSKIRLVGRRFFGRRTFVVRDRIGYGSQLDFWAPSCSQSRQWGRRTVRFKVMRYGR